MTQISQNCNLKVISSQNVLFYSPERYNIDHTGSKNSLESTKDPGNEQLTGIHHVLTCFSLGSGQIYKTKKGNCPKKTTLTGGPQKSIPNGIPRLQKKFGSNTF